MVGIVRGKVSGVHLVLTIGILRDPRHEDLDCFRAGEHGELHLHHEIRKVGMILFEGVVNGCCGLAAIDDLEVPRRF